jgi:predicted NACHT family NTPase
VIESPALSLVFTHGIDPHDLFAYAIALNLVRPIAPDSIWWRSLQELKNQLPDTSWESLPNFQKWWQECGSAWTEQLRTVMIEHRNIGHDWQFSDAQKELLQQYYNANELLNGLFE